MTAVRIVGRLLFIIVLAAVAAAVFVAGTIFTGMRAHARSSGTLAGAPVLASVQIIRDGRYIPHIRAQNEHDLFFAQGYAEASDRLFQMDLLRRYVRGTLSEVIGKAALPSDIDARMIDVNGIVERQWSKLDGSQQQHLNAFADGVNYAMAHEPLPVEFRALFYKPEPWRAQDSLVVGFATVLDLIDPWNDVAWRDRIIAAAPKALQRDLFSVSDPYFDAPVSMGKPAPLPTVPPIETGRRVLGLRAFADTAPIGSGNWAVGAGRSTTGRAILANDPHLRLQIPEIWYLVDLEAPGFHVAGGSLAGTPGVILGHNDNIAWGATNGTVVTEVLYRVAHPRPSRTETFHVRFAGDTRHIYSDDNGRFVVGDTYAVDWSAVTDSEPASTTFDGLDRATSIRDALGALARYNGPPQNFVLADTAGNAAYALAGPVPEDPTWGLRVHPAADPHYAEITRDRLPHVDPSREATVFTANNRVYGADYRLRLSPAFAPPYRASRIAALLASKQRLSPPDFAAMQTDTFSIPEFTIGRATATAAQRSRDSNVVNAVSLLKAWNGRFDADSKGAALAWRLRQVAVSRFDELLVGNDASNYHDVASGADLSLFMRALHERPHLAYPGGWDGFLNDALVATLRRDDAADVLAQTWGEYNRTPVRHPLAKLGLRFLNGVTLPGDGDSYSLHVQTDGHAQSFRAVWDVGNWDAGTIAIPNGESGEPGSGHYTDLTGDWIANRAVTLPYSDAAVKAAATETVTITP